MLADIKGKLSSSGSNLHERLEDNLTGNVFGACRYISPERFLWPLLQESYFQESHQSLCLQNPELLDMQFWPWLVEAEPDVLIDLVENGYRNTSIVIEVKLDSNLSGDDQLVRQIKGLAALRNDYRKILVYITSDIACPIDVLNWTRHEANKIGLDAVEIYWLSWHDFPKLIRNRQKILGGLRTPEWYVLTDLYQLLIRKGFGRFSSIKIPRIELPLGFTTIYSNAGFSLNQPNSKYYENYFIEHPTCLSALTMEGVNE